MTEETNGAAEAVTEESLLAEFEPAEAKETPETKPAQGEAETEGQTEEPRPKKTANDRIAELTKARREAERERDEARAQLAQRDAPADKEPDPQDYETDRDYLKAVARYEARQAAQEARTETLAAETARADKAQFDAWTDKAREAHADFDEVVLKGAQEGAWDCTKEMFEAMRDSEAGAGVAYHLASNPDEARRIAALPPIAQVREILKLEQGLTPPPTPKPNTVSKAPPPPQSQARGSSGQFKVAADTDDFSAFDKAY